MASSSSPPPPETSTSFIQMASSSSPPLETSIAIHEDLQCYLHASNVNVSNFVSEKLSGTENYDLWKIQMLCLLEIHDMRGIVDNLCVHLKASEDIKLMKKYDHLLKGWIFGSISKEVLEKVISLSSAEKVWKRLDSLYNPLTLLLQGKNLEAIFKHRVEIKTETETKKRERMERKEKLREATKEGNWAEVIHILTEHKDAAREEIDWVEDTVLHVAVKQAKNDVLRSLLGVLDGREEILEIKNMFGQTALHIAVDEGKTDAVKLLVERNKNLLSITDQDGNDPEKIAYVSKQHDTLTYLKEAKRKFEEDLANEEPHSLEDVVNAIYENQFAFEVMYQRISNRTLSLSESFKWFFQSVPVDRILVTMFLLGLRSMLLVVYNLICLLMLMAYVPFFLLYFLSWKVAAWSGMVPFIKRMMEKRDKWEKAHDLLCLICDTIGELGERGYYFKLILVVAGSQNAFPIVEEILSRSPNTIMRKDKKVLDIIQLAVIHRSDNFYNLIHHIGGLKRAYGTLKDRSGNNILHLVARLPPSHELKPKRGAALQLQREIQWFEEAKKLLEPAYIFRKNEDNETPSMVFSREHANLVKEAEAWMKTTAESCSIIAALITTIVFATAITVPGGSNQETGIPLLTKDTAFNIFGISNAISLFTSSTSLLVFLSILTARFAVEDFLVSLPRQLIIGLCALLLSVTSVMVSFSATLFIVFCHDKPWMLGPICALASLPITVFVSIQLPLLVDLFELTYGNYFGKPSNNHFGKRSNSQPSKSIPDYI